jgi:hypothetical protein
MRSFGVGAGVLLLVGAAMFGGCSSSTPEVVGAQSLRTVPPVTEPAETLASTVSSSLAASTTVVATTSVSSMPVSSVGSSVAPVLKSEDQLKIEYVVGEFRKRFWDQIIDRTFDVSVFDELSEGDQLVANRRSFDGRKDGTKYSKRGSVERGVVISTLIEGEIATAVSCNQNDIQVWDSKGTDNLDDDILLNGDMGTRAKQHKLRKRGDSWKIFSSQDVEADCSSAF